MQHFPTLSQLPRHYSEALMVGRVWREGHINGPCVVVVRKGVVLDITAQVQSVADLFEKEHLVDYLRMVEGESLGEVESLIQHSLNPTSASAYRLLAPSDLQAIKACGVTFAVSLLERVIEEQAAGDAKQADILRADIQKMIGSDLSSIRPGSAVAEKLKQDLIERDPQYQWIGPISETTYGFYVKSDSPLKIRSLEDAKRVGLIGVYRGDVRDQILTKLGFNNLDRANSNIFSFRKLMLGRVAMYADAPLAVKSLVESEGHNMTEVKLAYIFFRTQLYIATSKKIDPAIVAKWNRALEQMKKETTFLDIYRNHYPDVDPPGPTITKFE